LFIFHTGFGGPSPYPDLRNANPLPLHSIFNDENYRKTKFLILHQSYPYVKEAAILTSQFSHVYMDVSYFYLRPQTLQNSLRTILENAPPQKILYGSDTARLAETYGYSAWLFRIYLSRVLSEMGNNYSLSENELIEIAKMIMNENAEKLVGI
jgi:predicted TIM-barrel fold metal-dependent hydrolase